MTGGFMAAHSSVPNVVYRALLRLYPGRFHDEFASDMALDFADASDDGWRAAGWAGVLAVWARTAGDLVRSLAIQWLRTGVPVAALAGFGVVVTTAAATLTVAPDTPLFAKVAPDDRELVMLFFLVACVLLIIASTIIFTLWFLRPLLHRKKC
jgi:hypothetical protein